MSVQTPDTRSVPGLLALRPAPAGLPDPDLAPPIVAESGDPFASLRVIDLVARIERGRPIRLDDLVDALNARHLDWLFSKAVVADALIALQANWMADYRNMAGFELDEDQYGASLLVEDSPRVDPWIVRQAQHQAVGGDGVERLGASRARERGGGIARLELVRRRRSKEGPRQPLRICGAR